MAERALLDTGALVAFLHAGDAHHEATVEVFREFRGTFLTTEAVLTESVYLLGRVHGGAEACLEFFIRGAAVLVPPSRASLARCKAFMRKYSDVPADFADATLVTVAEEFGTRTIFTLDRRGFGAYRTDDGEHFDICP